ncbi:MAG: glycosyltransferase [Janthinobacterium lividum]
MRFAVLSPPFPSHAAAMEALTSVLIDRGHEVLWVQQADVRTQLKDPRIRFVAVGARTHPAGTLSDLLERAARPRGVFGLLRVIRDVASSTAMLCEEAPACLAKFRIDAVIADQMEAAGSLVAMSMKLPFVSVACALPVNREPAIPLPVMPWAYAHDEVGLHRNAVSERIHDWLMRPLTRVLAAQCARLRIPVRRTLAECVSPMLQLSQTTQGFDFPRNDMSSGFRHVGPLRPPQAVSTALPFELSQGKPFVFASLGTLQGGRLKLFLRIARACRAIDAQLLVAHCGGLDAQGISAVKRAGAKWVVDFAPQRDVLAKADLLITHAGLNTVMDGLAAGVPMLALPIAFDQPGIAARLVRCGAGLRLTPAAASRRAIERAVRTLLGTPEYRRRSAALGAEVRNAPGTQGAADLVEGLFTRHRRQEKPAHA